MSPLQSALARRLEGRRDKEVQPDRGKCVKLASHCPPTGALGGLNSVTALWPPSLSPGNLSWCLPSGWEWCVPSSHRLPVRTQCPQETSCAGNSALHTHWLLSRHAESPEGPLMAGAGPPFAGLISKHFSDPGCVFADTTE